MLQRYCAYLPLYSSASRGVLNIIEALYTLFSLSLLPCAIFGGTHEHLSFRVFSFVSFMTLFVDAIFAKTLISKKRNTQQDQRREKDTARLVFRINIIFLKLS